MAATILVAEDEEDIRKLVAITLRRAGYEVVQANDGDAALELLRLQLPDLLILDVMMPGRSGLEIARELASDPRTDRLPIIMLSALSQRAEVEAGLSTGAHRYLVKPLELTELLECVAEIIAPTD